MGAMASQITSLTIVYSKSNIKTPRHWPSPVTGEFPAQMASDAENVSIWWRHHDETRKILLRIQILEFGKAGTYIRRPSWVIWFEKRFIWASRL